MIKAEDLWPLLLRMSSEERRYLARLALAEKVLPIEAGDGERYAAMPARVDEFSTDRAEEPMSWESDGWEDVE